jgi:steroid delta-isomerase-like uncharacterized protein
MGVRENLRLIQARYEAVNAHDLDRFESFYAGSITWHDPGLSAPIKGPRAVRKRLKTLTTAFPDLQWKLERLFGQGENVCAEFTFVGTQRGELPDNVGKETLPASNKAVQLRAVGIYVVRENKIVDSRIYFDFGNLRAQIQKR